MLRYLSSLLLLLSLWACQKEPEGIEHRFFAYVDIPPGLNPWFSHYFTLRDLPAPGLQGPTVKSVRPGFIRLVLMEGEANTNFIRDAFLSMNADSNLLEIGFRQNALMANAVNFDLLTSIAELKDLTRENTLDLTLKLNFHYAPVVLTRLRVEYSMFVVEE
jgi:hypothetical protein